MARADQILATFTMTAGLGAYAGAFTAYKGTAYRAPAYLGNGVQGRFTVRECTSSSDLTPVTNGAWEEFFGTVSTSGSGSISRDALIDSSTGSFINWANPTTCYVEGGIYAIDLAGAAPDFGDGSDGAVTFDGSTTVLGLAPSGGVYTLTRNVFLTNATVNSGVTVKPNGFLIYGTGTLTNNGTIHDNGGNGTAATSGAAGAGGTGAAGNNTSAWGVAASAPPDGANGQRKTGSSTGNGVTSSASSTLGVSPSIGGSSGSSGSATTATAGTGNGVAATTQTAPTTAIGYPRSVPAALSGIAGAIGWRAGGASGPSGGVSCNTAGNVAGSGGGGGAGGFVGIAFANIINNGTISANGGNAGNSFASVTSGQSAAGPSAGGGGGLVIVVYGTFTGNTPTATGGVAGTGATAGGGTVGSATNGSDGTVILIPAALNTSSSTGLLPAPVNTLVTPDFRRLPRQARATLTGYATDGYTATNWYLQHNAGSSNVQLRNWSQGDSSPPVAFTVLGPSYLQLKNNAGAAAGVALCQFVEANGPGGLAAAQLQAQQIAASIIAVASTGTPTLKIAVREWQGTVDAPTKPVASWSGNVPTFQSTSYASVATGSGTLNTSTATTASATGTPTSSCVGLWVIVYVEGLAAGASLYLSQASLTRGSTLPSQWQPHPSDEELSQRYVFVPGPTRTFGHPWNDTKYIEWWYTAPCQMRASPSLFTSLTFSNTGFTPTGSNWTAATFASAGAITATGGVTYGMNLDGQFPLQVLGVYALAGTSFTGTGYAAASPVILSFGPSSILGFTAEIVPS